jgi:hypothetical protein
MVNKMQKQKISVEENTGNKKRLGVELKFELKI